MCGSRLPVPVPVLEYDIYTLYSPLIKVKKQVWRGSHRTGTCHVPCSTFWIVTPTMMQRYSLIALHRGLVAVPRPFSSQGLSSLFSPTDEHHALRSMLRSFVKKEVSDYTFARRTFTTNRDSSCHCHCHCLLRATATLSLYHHASTIQNTSARFPNAG